MVRKFSDFPRQVLSFLDVNHMIVGHFNETLGFPDPTWTALTVYSGNSATVPCGVSSPSFEVKFMTISGVEQAIGPDLSYDPKKGFNIARVTNKYNGPFKCQATDPESGRTEDYTIFFTFSECMAIQ